MKLYNIIDDKGRFVKFKATMEYGEQADSHTVSYLYCRDCYKETGWVMGFDRDGENGWSLLRPIEFLENKRRRYLL